MLTKVTIAAGVLAAGICGTWGYMHWTGSHVAEQLVPDRVFPARHDNEEPLYSIQNGDVYCHDTRLSPYGSSFRILTDGMPFSDYYAADEENVYKNCEVIAGADPATFKIIVVYYDANISMDYQYLFLNGKNAGPAVTDISIDWAPDIYSGHPTRGHSGPEHLARIDFNKVVILNFDSATITELPEVSAAELKPVFGPTERPIYFKDSKTVLCTYDGHITSIAGADAATFRSPTDDEFTQWKDVHGVDKNHVYSGCSIVN